MTGLDKITSQIQEEAEASAKERIEAAQKEAEQILADAKAVSRKLAVPISIAVAPHIKNSMASLAVVIPPKPTTGILTA